MPVVYLSDLAVGNIIQFAGPENTVVLFGVRLVGVNFDTGKKLLFSIIFVLAVYLFGKVLRALLSQKSWNKKSKRVRFWTRLKFGYCRAQRSGHWSFGKLPCSACTRRC